MFLFFSRIFVAVPSRATEDQGCRCEASRLSKLCHLCLWGPKQQKHHQQSRHVGHICHGASGRTKRNLFGAKKYVCADLWSPCLRISMSETWCEISLQTAVVSSKSDLNMRKRTLCPTTHPTAHFTFPPFGSSLASSSHYVQGTAHHNGLRPCRSVLSLGPSRSGPARGVPHADPSSTT